MADVPKDLLEEVKKLEKLFIVEQSKLKEITNHFVSELDKGQFPHNIPTGQTTGDSQLTIVGLSVEGGSIVS